MMDKYKQIFNLYYRNASFMLLSGILLLSAVISKVFYIKGNPFYGEDFATVLFVMILWLALYFGFMIKRQFANHRASLLPHYRKPHVNCIIAIFAFFVMAAVTWEHGFVLLIHISKDGIAGVYITCFFVAILIMYLGYLSIGRLFIYAYVAVLVIALNVTNIISAFESFVYLKYVVLVLGSLFTLFFIKRLLVLKEHHFEYHYLLSWSPKQYFANQLKSEILMAPVTKFFRQKEWRLVIPRYPRRKSIIARAFHWDYSESAGVKTVLVLIFLAVPMYLLFMKSYPLFANYFKNTYSNFLLLAITPVMITLGSYYKKMAFWGYDLIKPVDRKQYLAERGLVLLFDLIVYWFVFVVCFAVLPNIISQPEIFESLRFWGFLLLTGTFALFVTSWLSWLSCSTNSKIVLAHTSVLSVIIILLYYFASNFSLTMLAVINGICLFGGIIFLRNAYLAWCEKEFDS